jgi:hypothetical protein
VIGAIFVVRGAACVADARPGAVGSFCERRVVAVAAGAAAALLERPADRIPAAALSIVAVAAIGEVA